MDAPTLTKLVKELKELTDGENATKKAEVCLGGIAPTDKADRQEAKAILTRFKTEVVPTEDLLRVCHLPALDPAQLGSEAQIKAQIGAI